MYGETRLITNFQETLKNEYSFSPYFTAAFLIAFIGVWSTLYMNIHLDVDIAWLLQCLERFMAGGTYTESFYETNPPLSFLIYLPAHPLYTILGLSAKLSVLLTFLIYTAISNILLFKLLKNTTLSPTTCIAILAAAITAQTWGAGMTFGLKDHLILVFLTPFTLLQYQITTTPDKISKTTAIFGSLLGAIALCLKPHYAVIPAALLVHRIISTKSVKNIILSTELWTIAITFAAYLAFIYAVTPDFIHTIMPNVIELYGIETPFPIGMNLKSFVITIASAFIAYALLLANKGDENIEIRNSILLCAFISALCVIPYLLQNKGFYYHTIPYIGFGVMAMVLAIYGMSRLITKHKDISLWITLFIAGLLTYANTTSTGEGVMNNEQFKAQPIAEFIEENAQGGSYITYDMKSMLAPLPYLIDVKNASRFGQIWNLHALSILSSQTTDKNEQEKIKTKMMNVINMMAQDIEKNKPDVVAIPLYPTDPESNEPTEKFLEFLLANQNFATAMNEYQKETRLKFNKSLAVGNNDAKNIIWHDMYVRKTNQN